MSTEADIQFDSSDGCVTRNALLCCRSPVTCLNNEPKLVHSPPTKATMADQQQQQSGAIFIGTVGNHTHASNNNNNNNSHSNSNNNNNNGLKKSELSSPSPAADRRFEHSNEVTRSPTTSSDETDSSIPNTAPNSINKSKTMIDIRHGVTLRRVSPPKRPITVKQPDGPLRDVVLRKVEKKTLLEPPKTPRFEKSPPPRKLTFNRNKPKHHAAALNKTNAKNAHNNHHHSNNNNNSAAKPGSKAIPKSKSTNDVALAAKQQQAAADAAAKGKHKEPQVNLLKTLRPLEVHKIEGDKIIIIRRVPKSKRPKEALPALAPGDPQVIFFLYIFLLQNAMPNICAHNR